MNEQTFQVYDLSFLKAKAEQLGCKINNVLYFY